MQNQEQNENQEEAMSAEDVLTVVKIIRKAISYRTWLKEGIIGEKYIALTDEQKMAEMLKPRITFFFVDKAQKIPALFFRFIGSEFTTIEAFFYPFDAVHYFLNHARQSALRFSTSENTKEQIEEAAFGYAVDMFSIMIDNFYRRAELMMDSFTDEVVAQWMHQVQQNFAQHNAEQGFSIAMPKNHLTPKFIKNYAKDIVDLWKYQGQSYDSWRKAELVREYDLLLKHWRLFSQQSRTNEDWREYVKAGKFKDTPDDLLDKFENTDRADDAAVTIRISEFAIEHAARRVGLLKKKSVDKSVLEKRKQGIRVSGYSSKILFDFLKEGREIITQTAQFKARLAHDEMPNVPQQLNNSAYTEKLKSLQQKLDCIDDEFQKKGKQNNESA